jgi:hypothetical protein
MIWVLVVPMFLGVAALLLHWFATVSERFPRVDPTKCPRCGSPTRYHLALTICDGCSSVVAVDLRAMTRTNGGEAGRCAEDQTKRA